MNTSMLPAAHVACHTCRLRGGPFTPAEAEQHAGRHDQLQHRGQPTTVLE